MKLYINTHTHFNKKQFSFLTVSVFLHSNTHTYQYKYTLWKVKIYDFNCVISRLSYIKDFACFVTNEPRKPNTCNVFSSIQWLVQFEWLNNDNDKKKPYGLFLRMEFSCLKTTEPIQGNTKSVGVLGIPLINTRRMKGLKESVSDPWIGNPVS